MFSSVLVTKEGTSIDYYLRKVHGFEESDSLDMLDLCRDDSLVQKRLSPQPDFGQHSVRVGPLDICDWNTANPSAKHGDSLGE